MKETLHYLLMANHFMFQKELIASVKDTKLTSGQPKVLDYLRNHDGAIQKEIAIACHIEPASLTAILSGMEEKGYIERRMKDGNRRSSHVYLTKKGNTYVNRLVQEFDKIESKALMGFSEEEKQDLQDLLTRVYENMIKKEGINKE